MRAIRIIGVIVLVMMLAGLVLGTASCGTKDTTPPSIPTELATTIPANDSTPTFTWNAATDDSRVDHYLVSVDGGEWIDAGNTTEYTLDTTLSDGSHTFVVKAVDKAGNEGGVCSLTFTLDATSPTISGVTASGLTISSVAVTWTTDETSTSKVEYGTAATYGSSSALDSSLVTNHSVNLTGLDDGITYHYRVVSKDACGNEAKSGDYTFVIIWPVTGVSLNKTSITMAKGLSEQLIAAIQPSDATNKNVTWSSADNNVAGVSSSGLATATGVGTTVITVTTEDHGLTASCAVTVTAAELVSLAISPADSSVVIGNTLAFHATGTYTDSTTADLTAQVTWSSSDNATASISNTGGSEGIATGATKGTVTISAQLGSIGSSTTLKVTYPMYLEIGVPYIAEDGLTVTLNSLTIVEKTGSYEYQINYTLTNNTSDLQIDEGTWGLDNLNQYGFFGTLFPGDTLTRSYTFEDLISNTHSVLFYPNDWGGWSTDSLKWQVTIP